MLPPKDHEANPTELYQAFVQQNVRKLQALGRRAEKYGPAIIREAQIAVFEVLGRLRFNVSVKSKIQHPPPGATPRAFDFFENCCSNSPLPGPKCRSNAPH